MKFILLNEKGTFTENLNNVGKRYLKYTIEFSEKNPKIFIVYS